MSIFLNKDSKVLIQGITGKTGRHFTNEMIKHGTPLLAGVTPGKGGEKVNDIPVYNFVSEAVKDFGVDTSLIVVPPHLLLEAVIEAVDSGIKVISIYTENVRTHDSLRIVEYAKKNNVKLFGPNSAGLVTPGEANISDINDEILNPGRIGIVSRSGTLTYEVIDILNKNNLGISSLVCIGGDPIVGMQHYEVLQEFEKDSNTDAIIYLGEIGGNDEELSANIIKNLKKPVISYIAGLYAPEGKKMGHAGAIVQSQTESASAKISILKQVGAITIPVITDLEKALESIKN